MMARDSQSASADKQEFEVDLLFAEAVNHRAFNRESEALRCLERILVLDSRHVPALNECGLIDMAQGRLDEAAKSFEKILEIDPVDPYAINRLSMIYCERREVEKARRWLEQGLEINPYNPHMLTQLALVMHQVGAESKAAESLRKARRSRNLGNRISHQAVILAKHVAPGVVIAGLAHEIRNILHSTEMALELLGSDLARLLPQKSDQQQVGKRIGRIDSNSKRISHLVQHFRNIVKRERPEPSQLQASDLVNFAFDLLGEKLTNQGIRWKPVPDSGEVPPIFGNQVELEQVFINLISNAYDALAEARTESPEIRVEITSSFPGPGVVVRIHDNGPGIPEEVVPRMFELAFTNKSTGTGIGLWLCEFAVERASGQIALENTGPHGTTFKIEFPYQGAEDAKT